ncbi:hydrogen peroxide-inducible genes activator [Actinoallomurus soli]|uniref:hydrogen peroxide-inducible genes activator n=1 Tax=Actinoallomurus soli TaxID=2952535 RepID=UPI0020929597|nr:hydrogen peroxide-inducible genes activator [Actinoallomurus soli]MCO5969424.1 LysR substrate-binding domain-containing protein [Actinoallomurus soli]
MTISRPTVAQLRAFLALAEHLHFREAAAALRLSQPALSGAVAALEETLNARLVERTTRRVLLTPEGERVARRAERVLAELDGLVEEVSAPRRPLSGPLNLGVIPTVAPYLLPVVLPGLARAYPDLRLAVREQQTRDLVEELRAGRLEVAILALPADEGFAELPLYEEDFVLLAPESYGLGAGPVGRDVVRDLDVLLLNEGHCLRDQALEICREAGARPGDATYATSLATLVQLVSGGLGVTLVPESALPVETRRAERLSVTRFGDPAPYRRIGIIYRRTSPRADDFALLAQAVRASVHARRWRVRLPTVTALGDR